MKDIICLRDSITPGKVALNAFIGTDLKCKPIVGVGHKFSYPLYR
ncbi:MAG: hypothetical protein ACFWT3_00500 [Pseudomonas lundensis]|jgi:hypothetical protein